MSAFADVRYVPILLACLAIGAPGCSAIPPDPYLGTVDGTAWDPLYRGNPSGTDPAGCLAPRSGYRDQGGDPAAGKVLWYYLGNFSVSQLDVTNASDPAMKLPPEVYQISGCTTKGGTFDPDLDNYQTDVQYPVFASGAAEPTSKTSYKPWFYTTPVVPSGVGFSCNDIRNEQTIHSNGGWDTLLMKYGPGAQGAPLMVGEPNAADVRAGKVAFKDWPFYGLLAPIMHSESSAQSCPFYPHKPGDHLPAYPMVPGDPKADFVFANLSWWRGLLNGYLDAGDVPLYTSRSDCLGLFETGQSCMADADCKPGACFTGGAAGGRCVAASAQIDTGTSCRNAMGMPDKTLCGMGQSCSSSSLRCVQTASLTTTGKDCSSAPCDATAGEVCMSSGSGMNAKHTCARAPWPVCPQVTDVYVPDVEADKLGSGSVTVMVNGMSQSADPLVIFSKVRGDQGFSPVCRVRRYNAANLAKAISAGTSMCAGQEMGTGRPVCTVQQLLDSGTVLTESELSFVHCVFLGNP